MSSTKKSLVTGLLGYQLKKTQHALRIQMDIGLKALDLTTPQYAVLAQLELMGGLSNAELARRSFITAQTMHGIVSNLVDRKLIERHKAPEHGRIIITQLTARGLNVVQQAHQTIAKIEESMTKTLSANEIKQLNALLQACMKNLET